MLKRISIQNFKSLQDVTLDLQPVNLLIGPNNSRRAHHRRMVSRNVNLLIGPNNSGKSNLLKALESLLLDRALSDEQKKRLFSSIMTKIHVLSEFGEYPVNQP